MRKTVLKNIAVNRILLLLLLPIVLTTCKNNEVVNFNGVQIINIIESSGPQNHFYGTEIDQEQGSLHIPLKNLSDTGRDAWTLNYNLLNDHLYEKKGSMGDTNKILFLLNYNTSQYIAITSDWVKKRLGKPYYKLISMDKNFNIIKEYTFPLSGEFTISMNKLENGNIICIASNSMFYFDSNLNLIKRRTMTGGSGSYLLRIGKNTINIIWLINGEKARIVQYDEDGNIKSNEFNSPPGYLFNYKNLGNRIIFSEVDDGYIVVGNYERADKGKMLFVLHLDWDLNIIQSKLYEKTLFVKSEDEISIYQSNVIKANSSYYLVLNASNDQWNYREKSFLLKLNSDLNLEWKKELGKTKYFGGTYIDKYNNELICVNFNYSIEFFEHLYYFFRLDLDGNMLN